MAGKKTPTKTSKGKKPLSPYMKFCKEQRPKVIKENSKLSFGEIGKKLGEMWRGLTDAEKKKYQ